MFCRTLCTEGSCACELNCYDSRQCVKPCLHVTFASTLNSRRMASTIHSVCVCSTMDAILNCNANVDADANRNVTCEQTSRVNACETVNVYRRTSTDGEN